MSPKHVPQPRELTSLIYIDDDPNLRELARVIFSQDPALTVRTVASGPAGVDEALRSRPDLILLDALMPEVDGIETLALLRANPRLRAVPVVFVTAKAMTQQVRALRALDVADVICKPFDPRTLLTQVRQIWLRTAIAPAAAYSE